MISQWFSTNIDSLPGTCTEHLKVDLLCGPGAILGTDISDPLRSTKKE